VAGYVTDTTYADTFFRELSPAWLNYVAALNGVRPRRLDRPFSYLELGCGFGTSAVINAAAFPDGSFHACDFNREHVDGGRRHAAALGVANIAWHAQSFEALLAGDLPRFDFVVLHGVYSWVDASTRAVIRALIARTLSPGGLAYVSYNALPGWSHELPLRKLLVELASDAEGSAGDRAEAAAALLDRLSMAGFRYFTATPGAKTAADAYVRGEGHYLAHEFMNAAWEPFYAVDVADEFAAIGLHPAGSATLATNHLPLIVDEAVADAIASLHTPRQQQLALDFALNQRFRRDVFVRADGSGRDQRYLDDAVIGCADDVDCIDPVVRVPRGEIRFSDAFVADVRAVMDSGTFTLRAAVAMLAQGGHNPGGIARNLLCLVASGTLAPFARLSRVPASTPTGIASSTVERALSSIAADGARHPIVPSGVYGNGVKIEPREARALLTWAHTGNADELVRRRLPALSRLGIVQ
jgi:hypothetical protein